MKKLLVVILSMSMLFSLAGCGNGSGSSNSGSGDTGSSSGGNQESVILRFSDQNAEGTAVILWSRKFAELVEEKTNGSVTIEVYPNASLAAYGLESVQSGIADFTQYVPSSAADIDPRLAAFDAPYIYKSDEHRQAVFNRNSEPMQIMNEVLPENNLVLLTSFCSGYRNITCNYPIYTLDDIAGAKIRVVSGPLYLALFEAFGAAATPMNFSEVSTALITNVIDGQENPINVIATNTLYEIQDYMMMTNHMPTNHAIWMNHNKLMSLSEAQQEAIWEAAEEASLYMDNWVAEAEAQDLQTCIDNGMTIIDESNGLDLEAFTAVGMSMYEHFADEWGDMVEIIQSVSY